LSLSAEQSFVLQAYQHSLDSLRTGHCTVVEKNEIVKERRNILYAFDFDRDLVRCDTAIAGRKTYKLILAGDEMMVHVAGDHAVNKHARAVPIPLPQAAPIDVRTLGKAGMGDFNARTTLGAITKYLSAMKPLAVTHVGDVWTITLMHDEVEQQNMGPPVYMRTWHVVTVDPEMNYLPRESKWYQRGGLAPLGDDVTFTPEMFRQSASFNWKQIQATYVPTSVSFLGQPKSGWKIDLEFNWKTVNEGIPDALFTVESFELPPGTRIINEVSGRPFGEKIMPGIRGKEEPSKTDQSTLLESPVLRGVLIACVLSGGFALGIRRRRNRAGN